ncbi:hypothetical protein NEMBOFW57_001784 [Staphylotrichum longicolle]|uniref:Uncharacterized protein n=1 Tax=Staphylotrichum longicolle TaxID=669026 RepID=A0AAD4F267_9PEZI|nr:hypothetical protein NEMBOFW57_001784 [Staphylotrichum longicolle]
MDASPRLSQATTIAPLSVSLLLDRELARKEALAGRGNLMTGCGELDGYVLLGGFERGSVVGVSAEEEEVGLATLAHLLATESSARVMLVTTLPVTGLLPRLRKALVGEVSVVRDGLQNLQSKVRGCLERTSIAQVFDIEGLREVLRELEEAASVADAQPAPEVPKPDDTEPTEKSGCQKPQRTEIMDSEDEGHLSSPEASSTDEPPPKHDTQHLTSPTLQNTGTSSLPDMILVTHTSTLLNALFTGRDKDAAHNTMLLLSSHLRSLTRSPSLGGPLVMFLNSTTSPSSAHHAADGTVPPGTDSHRPPKHLEQTLRSIFNPPPPPPPPPSAGGGQQPLSVMRNKPSYGLVFSQMLDLHLLCTHCKIQMIELIRME